MMKRVTDEVIGELADLLETHYPPRVLGEIGVGEACDLVRRAVDPDAVESMLSRSTEIGHALIALNRCEGAVRGEQVRRNAIRDGLGDVESGLRDLVEAGLVVVRPAPGQRDWSLADELESRRYLQREILMSADLVAKWAGRITQTPPPAALAIADEDVAKLPGLSMEALELSLLHLTTALSHQSLQLNRDDTPNRRSLKRFVRGLRLPGNHRGDADPGRPEVFEPVYFLMAIALSLDLAVMEDHTIRADRTRCEAYFGGSEEQRNKALLRAYQFCDRWSEIEAARVLGASGLVTESETTRRGVLARSAECAKLGGGRGQVVGELSGLNLGEWSDVEETIGLLMTLDRGYLFRTFEHGVGGPDVGPRKFLAAMLTLALPWLGIAEYGTWVDTDGRARGVFRLTPRGARLLEGKAPEDDSSVVAGRALLVQPNLEVTVFVDYATLSMLQDLYRISERVTLADRVAVFRLTAETVQRGFGYGAEPDSVIAFLEDNARAPVPESVKFSIRDWERIQRKITLFSRGTLLSHPDPDALYDAVGTLSHYWDGEAPTLLDGNTLFVPGAGGTDLTSVVDLEPAHVIDYATEPPPCFRHLGGLELEELPCGLDLVTARDITDLATAATDTEGAPVWTLQPTQIREKWGTSSSQHLLLFLEPRLEQGLTPKLELLLLASLKSEIRAEVQTGIAVVTTSDEMVCDALLEVREIEGQTLARLGPTALLVPTSAAESISAVLSELGLS